MDGLFLCPSPQILCIIFFIFFFYQQYHFANNWSWTWIQGSSVRHTNGVTIHFQKSPNTFKETPFLSSENSRNSVLIVTEILNGKDEWISCFHDILNSRFLTQNVNLDIIQGKIHISRTILPEVYSRRVINIRFSSLKILLKHHYTILQYYNLTQYRLKCNISSFLSFYQQDVDLSLNMYNLNFQT